MNRRALCAFFLALGGTATWLSAAAIGPTPAGAAPPERQAKLSWWDRSPEKKVGHYWIKTDLDAEDADALAEHMNIMYSEYSKRLASLPVRAQEKLNVLIFKDQADYALTLRARFGVNPTGTGGMFFVTSAGSGLAFWTGGLPRQRIDHVMQHEGFHQFAYSRFGDDLPIWVNEGLAEFFGESVIVGKTLVIGQSTPRVLDAVKDAIELKKHVPFEQMLSMTPQGWGAALQDGSAALQYQQAWSMVHFLVYGDGGKYVGAFETYLKHLNNGLPSAEAFRRSFGDDIGAFEKRWREYALAAKPSAFVTALERITFLADGALELSRRKVPPPDSMDALKAALREIKFSQTQSTHGTESKIDAASDEPFTIPMDDLCREQPAFTASKFKPTGMSRREKMLDDANPTPPVIATENLKPDSLRVKWIRDEKANTWSYQVVVKPS